MRHRWKPLAATLLLFGATSTAAFSALPADTEEQPNILFAIADDWSYPHAGAYGDRTVQTPTFDRIAHEGVLFQHAFISSPSCTPSRAAILSGQDFWRLGEGANLHSTLDKNLPLYTDLLGEIGYHVGFTRKGWGPGQFERGGRTENPAGPRFKDFENFLSKRPDGAPFCFWFGSIDPHRPYNPQLRKEQGIDPDNVEIPATFPDVAAAREDMADYYAEVQRFDREVGAILERLRKMGELENTIVVISSDNGMPFPRHKANLYDGGTHVPLAIDWGQHVPGDRKVTDFVSLTDLAPTFLKAAGVDVPEVMTGRSLLDLLTSEKEGRVDPARDRVFVGRERHTLAQEAPESGGYPARAIRTDDFLYIHNFEPSRWPAGTPDHTKTYRNNGWLRDTDNGPTKFYLWANRDLPEIQALYQLAFARRPAEELYDLRQDPDQMKNVASDLAYSETLAELRAQLMDYLRQTSDPRVVGGGEAFDTYLYTGTIQPWPGAEVFEKYKEPTE